MKNEEVAQIFGKLADVLEFKGENPFKVNAYRKAARMIGALREDIEQMVRSGALRKVPGIGEAIVEKTKEYLETGRLRKLEEAEEDLSEELLALLEIPDLSPRTLALLHRTLGIGSLQELQQAVEEGALNHVPGLSKKRAEEVAECVSKTALAVS